MTNIIPKAEETQIFFSLNKPSGEPTPTPTPTPTQSCPPVTEPDCSMPLVNDVSVYKEEKQYEYGWVTIDGVQTWCLISVSCVCKDTPPQPTCDSGNPPLARTAGGCTWGWYCVPTTGPCDCPCCPSAIGPLAENSYCGDNGSEYIEVIKTVDGNLGIMEEEPLSRSLLGENSYKVKDENQGIVLMSSIDMANDCASESLYILHDSPVANTEPTLLSAQAVHLVPPGYIAVNWEAVETTGCRVVVEYSVDNSIWLIWSQIEITRDNIGKFLFGIPKINDVFYDVSNFYFRVKFTSSEVANGTISAKYVPSSRIELKV